MMIFHIVGGGLVWRVLTDYMLHTAQCSQHDTACQHCSVQLVAENTTTFRNIPNLSFKFRRSEEGKEAVVMVYDIIMCLLSNYEIVEPL